MNRRISSLRRSVRSLLGIGTLFVSLGFAGASVAPAAALPDTASSPADKTVPASAAPRVKADRDGDKLFDDLESRLAALGTTERLSVIVTLAAPASQERLGELSKRVGAFTTTHRFSIVDGFAAAVTKGQAQALTRVP